MATGGSDGDRPIVQCQHVKESPTLLSSKKGNSQGARMASEKFCLKWNDFESNISVALRELREEKDLFDVFEYAEYAEHADYANYAKYKEHAKYAMYAKYTIYAKYAEY